MLVYFFVVLKIKSNYSYNTKKRNNIVLLKKKIRSRQLRIEVYGHPLTWRKIHQLLSIDPYCFS